MKRHIRIWFKFITVLTWSHALVAWIYHLNLAVPFKTEIQPCVLLTFQVVAGSHTVLMNDFEVAFFDKHINELSCFK